MRPHESVVRIRKANSGNRDVMTLHTDQGGMTRPAVVFFVRLDSLVNSSESIILLAWRYQHPLAYNSVFTDVCVTTVTLAPADFIFLSVNFIYVLAVFTGY